MVEGPVKNAAHQAGGKGNEFSETEREGGRDRRRDVPEGHERTRGGFEEVLPSSFPAARSFGGSTMAMCARADITSQAIRKFLQYRVSRYDKR